MNLQILNKTKSVSMYDFIFLSWFSSKSIGNSYMKVVPIQLEYKYVEMHCLLMGNTDFD